MRNSTLHEIRRTLTAMFMCLSAIITNAQVAPRFSFDTSIEGQTTVTITCADKTAKLYYSTGSETNIGMRTNLYSTWGEYTDPLVFTCPDTLYAYAVYGDNFKTVKSNITNVVINNCKAWLDIFGLFTGNESALSDEGFKVTSTTQSTNWITSAVNLTAIGTEYDNRDDTIFYATPMDADRYGKAYDNALKLGEGTKADASLITNIWKYAGPFDVKVFACVPEGELVVQVSKNKTDWTDLGDVMTSGDQMLHKFMRRYDGYNEMYIRVTQKTAAPGAKIYTVQICNEGELTQNLLRNTWQPAYDTYSEGTATTPAAPEIVEYHAYNNTEGYGGISFKVDGSNSVGQPLADNKLYYKLWSDINGTLSPIVFNSTNSPFTKDTEEIPLNYTDKNMIWHYNKLGTNVVFFISGTSTTYTRVGVQTIYKGGGESRASEITWSTPTGINNITANDVNSDAIYNLQGVRLKTPQKGINIIGGKKILK